MIRNHYTNCTYCGKACRPGQRLGGEPRLHGGWAYWYHRRCFEQHVQELAEAWNRRHAACPEPHIAGTCRA